MTQSHGTQDLNGSRVSDERLAEMLAGLRQYSHMEHASLGFPIFEIKAILTELQSLRSEPSEPVAWRYCTTDIDGAEWPWTYTESKKTAKEREDRGFVVEPLYASLAAGEAK